MSRELQKLNKNSQIGNDLPNWINKSLQNFMLSVVTLEHILLSHTLQKFRLINLLFQESGVNISLITLRSSLRATL